MSDIAIPNQNDNTPASAEPTLMAKGVEKLRQHAELKAMAIDYADFITKTGACPEIYKNKPEDAAAAIIRGAALGFDPDGALEAFFVIKGKTGMYARAMQAVAENAGCSMWEVEASDEAVTWAGTKPGNPHVHTVTWTIQRAKTAGYAGSNSRYKTNATEMLRSKCQGELARILAPGALMGLYTEQEPTAFTPVPVKATAERVTEQRGMDQVRAALEAKKEAPKQQPQGDKLMAWIGHQTDVEALSKMLQSLPSKLDASTDPAPLLDAVMDKATSLGATEQQLDSLAELAGEAANQMGVTNA